jgi:penicillin-binding protein 1C
MTAPRVAARSRTPAWWRPPAWPLLLAALAVAPAACALPTFAELRAAHDPSDAVLLDRHGTPLQSLRTDRQRRRLHWVPLHEMSPALLQSIVLSEDRRFWQHAGVDWAGVARSAWANAWNTRTQGASTLTMQLAGLIDDGLGRPASGRSLAQKVGQALLATQLEARWRKHEILEAYLNVVPLRGELVGIEALAQTLFGKHAGGLDAQEAAIAAALVRAPNALPARVAERACGVLQLQQLPCTGLAGLSEAALKRSGGRALGEALAPHLARQVLRPGGPAQVRSTLDARTQRLALRTLRQQLAELTRRHVEDGAVLVLDNASGEVLAWVGSSGADLSDAPQVDAVLARRQPGSTLKPFVYQLAFEQRLLTPASLLDDSPAQIGTRAGLYQPQNYDRQFRGWVSARQALGGSLNIPAVRAGALLPPDALWQRLNALGLGLEQPAGYYGQALALGSAEVTLLALTNAYRTLANGGLHSAVRWRTDATPGPAPRHVADPAAVYLVSDILGDNGARAGTFGLDSALALPFAAAVKTGTSKDLRDNWCIGYSTRFTVGVWVGNASGAPMHEVSGVSGAAPVWRALMLALHEGRPPAPAPLPGGIVASALRHADDREPPRTELFLAGTELALVQPTAQVSQPARRFGITHPRDGSVLALDPDIPPAAQRLVFEGESGTWLVNGRRIGQGARVSWAPWPGRHEVSLLDRHGRLLQQVRLEVRGAATRVAAGSR